MNALQNANFVKTVFICNMQQEGRDMLKNISWPIKESNPGVRFFFFFFFFKHFLEARRNLLSAVFQINIHSWS